MRINLETIKSSCCKNDTLTENEGFEAVFATYGVKINDVMHVAEQRGLRLIIQRRDDELPDKGVPIMLSDEEKEFLQSLMQMWIDAFFAGVNASTTSIREWN